MRSSIDARRRKWWTLSGPLALAATIVASAAPADAQAAGVTVDNTQGRAKAIAISPPDVDQEEKVDSSLFSSFNETATASASGDEGTASATAAASGSLSGGFNDLTTVSANGSGEASFTDVNPDQNVANIDAEARESSFQVSFDVPEPGVTYSLSGSVSASSSDASFPCTAATVILDETQFLVRDGGDSGSCDGPTNLPISASGTLAPGEHQIVGGAGVFQGSKLGSGGANANANWSFTLSLGQQNSDTDGDALPDSWEEDGVDVDGDGTADLDLPAMGADPDHKDIFIEVDHMPGHRMDDAQIDAVTQAFKTAPVANPDGQAGITLHVDNGPGSTMDPVSGSTWGSLSDQDSLAHQNVLGSDFTVGGQRRYDWSQFESIRQTKLLAVRRPAFHYVVAAHSGPGQRFAGTSRGVTGGAADFIVAMHENCNPTPPLATECASPDPEYTAATFMHELGHNLSLQHGGTDEDARKPNYLSVMNYNFGWGLVLFDGSFELDYSRFNLPLDENRLNEQRGFGIDSGPLTAFKTIFRCPNDGPKHRIPLTTEQVDWNCDRTILGGSGNVSSDASANGTIGPLTGPIDWNRLVFSGGGIGALNQPPGAEDTVLNEPTPAELQRNRDVLESGTLPPIDPPADPRPRNEFSFGKAKRNKRRGTAKLTVNVPGPGALELAQAKKVKGDQARAEAAGEATLLVKPRGKAKKKLNRRGKAKLSAEVTYTPDGGDPNTQTASVKVVRK